jgi:hypothetical protein
MQGHKFCYGQNNIIEMLEWIEVYIVLSCISLCAPHIIFRITVWD